MRNRFAVVVSLIAAPLVAAAGQNVAPRNVISIQPLNAMLTIFSGEYERGMTQAVSFGVGGTYFSVGAANNEVTYTSGDVKLRLYPGAALNGFSFGASVGVANVSGKSATGVSESGSGATIGLLLEYQWLLGSKGSWAMSLGAGAKTLMVDDSKFSSADFIKSYPTGRFSIGYAW